jgi:hypothetical protein
MKVLVRPGGKQLIAVGRETTVRIYQQRRAPSRLGAFSLPETWCVYAAAVAMVLGAAVIAGRACSRRMDRPLPSAFRAAVAMPAVGPGVNLADRVVALAADAVYQPSPAASPTSLAIAWGALLLAMAAAVGLARLRRGWWVVELALVGLAGAVLLLLARPFALAIPPGRRTLNLAPFTWHGVAVNATASVSALLLVWGATWVLVLGGLLLRKDVRALYPRAPRRTRFDKGPRGFPLD